MSTELHPLEGRYDDILSVCRRLRERDRQEIFATRYDETPEALAQDTYALRGFAWLAYRDGVPVAVMGAWPAHPTLWHVFAYGTADWPKVVLALTRHARRFVIPALHRAGYRRAECKALRGHRDARRWIEAIGGAAECVHKNYGKGGEDFVGYCWTPDRTQAYNVLRD